MKEFIRNHSFSVSFIVVLFSVVFFYDRNSGDIQRLEGFSMGTTYQFQIANFPENIDREQLATDLNDLLVKLDRGIFSTYSQDSELSRFNQQDVDVPFPASDDLVEVLVMARQISDLSDGAFDISVGPLVNLWGFGPDKFSDVPTATDIDSILVFVSQDLIEIEKNKIRKKDARVQIDLSSIAKGYAVDKIIESLNYDNIFVEIGGEVRGKSNGKIWRVGINTPSIDNISNEIEYVASIKNASIATSGNYRNFYIDKDNRFYHHEINPLTGYPIMSQLASISVFAETSCMEADGLATALYMMETNDINNFFEETDFEGLMILVDPDMSFKQIVSENFPKN